MNEPCPDRSTLEAALWYRRRGWSVIPVGRNKKPVRGLKWKRYETELPAESQVLDWFTKYPDANVAVVLGPVSGDLASRDFDSDEAWQAFQREYPDLAKTLPVVSTFRGKHVYFTGTTGIRIFRDGELRGEGGYCVLPPSVHETGIIYRWDQPRNGAVPIVDPIIFAREFASVTENKDSREN